MAGSRKIDLLINQISHIINKRMRFGVAFSESAIPEWQQCYLNYEALKLFVTIIKITVQEVKKCEKIIKQNDQSSNVTETSILVLGDLQKVNEIKRQLRNNLRLFNRQFYHTFFIQVEVVQLFYQMKVLDIEDRFNVIRKIKQVQLDQQKMSLFLTYMEYSYIEISYLTQMRDANLQAERKILKKHKKCADQIVPTPQASHQKIRRMDKIQQKYLGQIQDIYAEVNKEVEGKKAREYLRDIAKKEYSSAMQYFLMGFGVGASVVGIAITIFIIENKQLNIQNNSRFKRDFPTWRGIAIFILYIWVLGFNLYCFERYKISHRLTFKFNDHHYSTSTQIFKLAGIFSTIFLGLFLFYLLFEAKTISDEQTSFRRQYLVSFIWLALFIYLLTPLPIFNHKGRLYALKLIWRSLASPFIGVDFTIIWMTDQWQSLTTPLRDMAYTFCYYTRIDFDNELENSHCQNNSAFEVVLLVVIVAISYRIFQCLRLGWDQGFWLRSHMFNTIKYILSLLSAIFSYVYKNDEDKWLVPLVLISAISTIYAYCWDLLMDWDLMQILNRDDKHFLLRQYITFNKKAYYAIMVSNLIMRLAWTLSFAPSIVELFGNSNLFTFLTGTIEIMRRGFWNLFRVQKEHLANCRDFKAIPDIEPLQANLLQGYYNKQGGQDHRDKGHNETRQLIRKQFIELLKSKIDQRQRENNTISKKFHKQQLQKLKKIQKRLQKILDKEE